MEEEAAPVIDRGIARGGLMAAAMVLIAAAIPHSAVGQPRAVYPAWFLNPPRIDSGVIAVGFGLKYATIATSIAEATAAAHRATLVASRSRVTVDMLMETIAGARERRGEKYVEIPLADSANLKFVDVDTAVVGSFVMVLTSTSPLATVDDTPTPLTSTPPAWVTSPPRSDDGLTVVGSAPMYFYEHNSWIEAEARARRAAAFEASSTTRDLQRTDGSEVGRATDGATSMSTDVILDGATVIARWRDRNVAYVLLRVASTSRASR